MVEHKKMKKILNELGLTELNRIKDIRENLGLSVSDLATICDISVGEISYIENHLRIPSQYVQIKITRAFIKLGVNPNDVFVFY